jgi:YgiT-type zinc finger domain-containing protein
MSQEDVFKFFMDELTALERRVAALEMSARNEEASLCPSCGSKAAYVVGTRRPKAPKGWGVLIKTTPVIHCAACGHEEAV